MYSKFPQIAEWWSLNSTKQYLLFIHSAFYYIVLLSFYANIKLALVYKQQLLQLESSNKNQLCSFGLQ